MEPSISCWAKIGSSRDHFIMFTFEMLEFGRSGVVEVFVMDPFDFCCCCCCCIVLFSPANGSIPWGLILSYLVFEGMLLKIRPGRAEHIRGGEACLIHPGSRELLFKHPTLTGHVLTLSSTLCICAYIFMPHAYMCTPHIYIYTSQNTNIYI